MLNNNNKIGNGGIHHHHQSMENMNNYEMSTSNGRLFTLPQNASIPLDWTLTRRDLMPLPKMGMFNSSSRRYAVSDHSLISPGNSRSPLHSENIMHRSGGIPDRYSPYTGTFVDATSPGLANRIVLYSNSPGSSNGGVTLQEKRSPIVTHQAKYSRPGVFPIVHLYKKAEESPPQFQEKRVTIRISHSADRSKYHTPEHNRLLLEKITSSVDESHNNNSSSVESHGTRSVLDALKGMSRKRTKSANEDPIHYLLNIKSTEESVSKRNRLEHSGDYTEATANGLGGTLKNPVIMHSNDGSNKSATAVVSNLRKLYESTHEITASHSSMMKRPHSIDTETIDTVLLQPPRKKSKSVDATTQTDRSKAISTMTSDSEFDDESKNLSKDRKLTSTGSSKRDASINTDEAPVLKRVDGSTSPLKPIVCNIFNSDALETARKNRLYSLLDQFVDDADDNIPNNVKDNGSTHIHDKQQEQTTLTTPEKPLTSILTRQNSGSNQKKHVTFNLPTSGGTESVVPNTATSTVTETSVPFKLIATSDSSEVTTSSATVSNSTTTAISTTVTDSTISTSSTPAMSSPQLNFKFSPTPVPPLPTTATTSTAQQSPKKLGGFKFDLQVPSKSTVGDTAGDSALKFNVSPVATTDPINTIKQPIFSFTPSATSPSTIGQPSPVKSTPLLTFGSQSSSTSVDPNKTATTSSTVTDTQPLFNFNNVPKTTAGSTLPFSFNATTVTTTSTSVTDGFIATSQAKLPTSVTSSSTSGFAFGTTSSPLSSTTSTTLGGFGANLRFAFSPGTTSTTTVPAATTTTTMTPSSTTTLPSNLFGSTFNNNTSAQFGVPMVDDITSTTPKTGGTIVPVPTTTTATAFGFNFTPTTTTTSTTMPVFNFGSKSSGVTGFGTPAPTTVTAAAASSTPLFGGTTFPAFGNAAIAASNNTPTFGALTPVAVSTTTPTTPIFGSITTPLKPASGTTVGFGSTTTPSGFSGFGGGASATFGSTQFGAANNSPATPFATQNSTVATTQVTSSTLPFGNSTSTGTPSTFNPFANSNSSTITGFGGGGGFGTPQQLGSTSISTPTFGALNSNSSVGGAGGFGTNNSATTIPKLPAVFQFGSGAAAAANSTAGPAATGGVFAFGAASATATGEPPKPFVFNSAPSQFSLPAGNATMFTIGASSGAGTGASGPLSRSSRPHLRAKRRT